MKKIPPLWTLVIYRKRIIWYLLFVFIAGIKTEAQEYNRIIGTNEDTSYVATLFKRAAAVRDMFPDSAIILARKAFIISTSIGDTTCMAKSLLNIGGYLFDEQKYPQSKQIFYQAIPYCLAAKKNSIMALLYDDLANIYTEQGHTDSAIYYYFLSLQEVAKEGGKDTAMLMRTYANIGGSLMVARQNAQALYYSRKSALLAIQKRDTDILELDYMNIGLAQANKDTAQYYLKLAINLCRQQPESKKISHLFFALGSNYGNSGNIEMAKIYYDSTILTDPTGTMRDPDFSRNMGEVYYDLGNYYKAIQFYKRSLSISKQENTLGLTLEAYSSLATSYHKVGNEGLAYNYMKAYSDLKDSLLNNEKIETINQLEVKYRVVEKEKEIAKFQAQQYRQRNQLQQKNILIISTVAVSLLILSFLIGIYRINIQKQKVQAAKINALTQQQEVERLQTIMQTEEQERSRIARDLHDGIGVLLSASIMNYTVLGRENYLQPAAIQTYQEGMQLLHEMRKEVRNIAYNLIPEMMAEKNLVEVIQALTKRLQKNSNTFIDMHNYGNVVMLEPQLSYSAYRMVEELLHNAIKHAEATRILLQMIYHEEGLNIIAEDNGKGFDMDSVHGGMGLNNLKIRAESAGIQLTITSRKGAGTTVELEIPVKNYILENKEQYDNPKA